MMLQIFETTDDRFVGHIFDGTIPIVIGGVVIPIESKKLIAPGVYSFSNSNYVIYAREV